MKFNPFKKKKEQKENKRQIKVKQLKKDYENGKILQLDNEVDNKEYFKTIENGNNNTNK